MQKEKTTLSSSTNRGVLSQLSVTNRMLPLYIFLSMGTGIIVGRELPGLNIWLSRINISGTSLPITVGLILMMYPILAKVRFDEVSGVASSRKLVLVSLLLNWVVGPALMFSLAWLMLPDSPAYRDGLIIVGLARCIAMVLVWNNLALGNREAAVALVALNSFFQIVAFSGLAYFYLKILPSWLGLSGLDFHVSMWVIAKNVIVFLGLPLMAGWLTRFVIERSKGREWYEKRFIRSISPISLYGLLFTLIVLFALQGNSVIQNLGGVARVGLPLLAYFGIMWIGSFALGHRIGLNYEDTTTLAFTAASNNFELAIAVTLGVFGIASSQVLAAAVGPLIEVPVLVILVYAALWSRRYF